ncbi:MULTISPECIES: flagellar hook-associated protein FlgK [Nocardioides]|uniref:flagellar hook-associated protein FlgK n=1 Tax=Nocardioides TaxID=1839 RepID=UPI00187A8960|nr:MULTISPECIES: flagellar hook-associated protein FlgK [Nocardioides]MBJ7529456.1 flagellar hook-associated protein FlgK [Nocardioides sp.]MCM3514784.1 flagellar hook-associated protein FlgK [Nocardioides sp. P86]
MSGSLSSLNTALTALRYQRVALDVASNNVANATTEGYTRRRVVGETIGSASVPALWSRYEGASGSVGAGVTTRSVDRMTDDLLDARSRRENANQSYLDVRSATLQRVESGIGEPGDSGVSAALTSFRSSWHDLANDPGSAAAREVVLARATALVDSVHAQARQVSDEQADQRVRLQGVVADVNTTATELAATNRALAAASLDGVDTSDLADQRDALALRLASLTGGTASPRSDGGFDVSLGGVPLVEGGTAHTLQIASGVTAGGGDDGQPVTFSITTGGAAPTTTAVPAGLKGETGAVADLLTTTLPAYAAGLGAVVATLAGEVNALHQAGYDQGGAAGGPFFSFDPADPAGSLAVAVTSASGVAASAAAGGGLDGTQADRLATAGAAEGAYARLVTGFGTEVASVQRLATTQQLLTAQVDSAREQLSGVNLDEEMVSMLSAQRSYEAAARVMTVVDSVLDTLINRTGLLR